MSEAWLRIGVVGLGIGRDHVEAYRGDPRCRVVAVCDRDPDTFAQFPDIPGSTNPAELLTRDDIDAVSIATHDDAHAEQVVMALAHGKHVFVEKPLCLHESDARAIRSALRARPDLRLSSNLILRKSPRFSLVRERIAHGDFGQIYSVDAQYLYGRRERLVDGWRAGLDHYSLVLGGAIHMIDLAMWLIDDRIVEVTAMQNKIATAGTRFAHPDLTLALVRFARGAVGQIGVHGACVHPHFHALSLFGTKATFHHRPEAGLVYHSTKPDDAPERIDLPYRGYRRGDLIPEFVNSIESRTESGVTTDEVFRAMAVCFAIERSAASGRPEPVENL